MLSALVLYRADPSARAPAEPAVRTLAALVPAAMEGVLRDVALAGPAAAGFESVADHAGCLWVEAEDEKTQIARGGAALRERNVFVIVAGAIPEPGFTQELDDMLREGASSVALRFAPASFMQRLAPSLAPVAAQIVPRDLLLSGRAARFADLQRMVRPARAMVARARAFKQTAFK